MHHTPFDERPVAPFDQSFAGLQARRRLDEAEARLAEGMDKEVAALLPLMLALTRLAARRDVTTLLGAEGAR